MLLLPRGAGAPFSLSGAGVELWGLLAEPQTLGSSADQLAKRFQVDTEEVASSLEPLLDELVRVQVVEPVES